MDFRWLRRDRVTWPSQLAPRWRKVLGDLTSNKTRAALVLLSISISVLTVGAISAAQEIVMRSMTESYAGVSPASATLEVEPFGDELVQAVRAMPSIREAEGRRRV